MSVSNDITGIHLHISHATTAVWWYRTLEEGWMQKRESDQEQNPVAHHKRVCEYISIVHNRKAQVRFKPEVHAQLPCKRTAGDAADSEK